MAHSSKPWSLASLFQRSPRSFQIVRLAYGRMANRMMAHLVAVELARRLGDAKLLGAPIEEWGLHLPPAKRRCANYPLLEGQHFDLDVIAGAMRRHGAKGIRFKTAGASIRAFPPKEVARRLFDLGAQDHARLGADELAIHIRLEDILRNAHPDYGPLGIGYYEALVEETGLSPVFIGQIGDDPYSEALRARFKGARVLAGNSAVYDFATLGMAPNVALGISTFSWLAAWLGQNQSIHFPLSGLLHPLHALQSNLLIEGDPRVKYYEFPHRKWTGEQAQVDEAINGFVGHRISDDRFDQIATEAASQAADARAVWERDFLAQF